MRIKNTVLIILTLIIIVALGIVLFSRSQKGALDTVAPQPTKQLYPQTLPYIETYTHPQSGYSIRVPEQWTIEVIGKREAYDTISLKSPDYMDPKEPLGRIQQGANIEIQVISRKIKDLDELFGENMLTGRLAQNKRFIEVDGKRAAQYEFTEEGTVNATATKLIDTEYLYSIYFAQSSEDAKMKYWADYQHILSSFQTQKN